MTLAIYISLVAVVFGASLLAGLRPACWFLVPEVWLWYRLFGIRVTPVYRKTVGVLYCVLGVGFLFLDRILAFLL